MGFIIIYCPRPSRNTSIIDNMMRQGENPQHVMHTLNQQHAEDGNVERAIILSSVTDEDRTKVLGSKRKSCNDDDDGGGGKQRANTTGNDGVMHLSQTSIGSSPEVVKVRGRNILDYTANRNELTPIQRKVAVTLTKHPQKVKVVRNSIEDDMI